MLRIILLVCAESYFSNVKDVPWLSKGWENAETTISKSIVYQVSASMLVAEATRTQNVCRAWTFFSPQCNQYARCFSKHIQQALSSGSFHFPSSLPLLSLRGILLLFLSLLHTLMDTHIPWQTHTRGGWGVRAHSRGRRSVAIHPGSELSNEWL